MSTTTIVIGWYHRPADEDTEVHEDKREYKGPNMFDTDPEIAKRVVAMELGYKYPDEIDFRYFDRSLEDEWTDR